jgi:hypothetical protein
MDMLFHVSYVLEENPETIALTVVALPKLFCSKSLYLILGWVKLGSVRLD